MTKKQKLDLLFNGKLPENEKLFRPILMHFAARHSNYSYAAFASNYKVLVESNLKALDDFDMDMVGLISDPYRETSAFGARVTYPAEAVPKCEETIIHTIDDVKKLRNPDLYLAERTRDRILGADYFQKKLQGTVPVIGWIEGPLAEACTLVGVGDMLINLMMDSEFAELLLDKCMSTAKEFARLQLEAGCDIIGIGDAICSQVDLNTYDRYVKNRHKEIINYIHEKSGRVKLHICGNITHLLPSIKDLGMDILDLDWEVDLNNAFDLMGDKVVRCGNIEPVFIQNATSEEIGTIVREICRAEMGRKHIISGGCEITVNTPKENLLEMRNASKE
jgi:uroporphyrinogen decarboxylase